MSLIQIQKQYERIPTFECIEGCTDCCGPVPFTEDEYVLVKDKKQLTTYRCQYVGEKGCTIYEQRPLLCRLFGTVNRSNMLCPHGRRPDVLLTDIQGLTIMRHYLKNPMAQDPLRKDIAWATSLVRPTAVISSNTLPTTGTDHNN